MLKRDVDEKVGSEMKAAKPLPVVMFDCPQDLCLVMCLP